MSINLLAWRENQRQRAYRQFLLLIALIILLEASGIFCWYQWLSSLKRQQQQEISALNGELIMKNKMFAQMHGSGEQLKALTHLQSQLEHLTAARRQLLAALNDLPALIPASSHIVRLDYNRQLRVTFAARNNRDLPQLVKRLQSKFVAKLVANTQKTNGFYQFELLLVLTQPGL